MFKFYDTPIEGLKVIDPFYFEDNRGVLKKCFEKNIFAQNGIHLNPVEEIETTSKKGVLRGLHLQLQHSQAKLLRVVRGKIFDVSVDIRKESKTFGQWYSIYLSAENKKMLYIPSGFAHGCLSMQEDTTFYYLCSEAYHPEFNSGIIWKDEELCINWPSDMLDKISVSEKDQRLLKFSQLKSLL